MKTHIRQRAQRLGAEVGSLLADLVDLQRMFSSLQSVPNGAEAPVSSSEYLRAYA